jgi:hypothetical protein
LTSNGIIGGQVKVVIRRRGTTILAFMGGSDKPFYEEDVPFFMPDEKVAERIHGALSDGTLYDAIHDVVMNTRKTT